MKVVGDRILVEPIQESDTSGFETVTSKKPQKGKIIAVGPGRSAVDKMLLQVDDIILYGKGAGTQVVIQGRELTIMREGDAYCAL